MSTVTVRRTRTFPTGSYASEKIMLTYEMPIPDAAELPTEMRKGLALLDILLDAEVSRFKKNANSRQLVYPYDEKLSQPPQGFRVAEQV